MNKTYLSNCDHITFGLLQPAQVSIFYGKIIRAAPSRGICIRIHDWNIELDKERDEIKPKQPSVQYLNPQSPDPKEYVRSSAELQPLPYKNTTYSCGLELKASVGQLILAWKR